MSEFSKFSQDEQMVMISKKIYLDDIDPYFLMKTKPLSLDTLFDKYSILRKKNHPDKGGNNENFILINEALQTMIKIRNIIQNDDKEFIQLRQSYFENLKNEQSDDINLNFYDGGGNFSINKFNECFNKFKFENENDGYGDEMIKSSPDRDDIDIEQINFKHFHEKFVKENSKNNNKIQLYKSPDACNNFDNYSGIVSNSKSDYSSNNFSDYKKAFSESSVDYNQNIEKRNLEDYKKKREDPQSLLLSAEEKEVIDQEKEELARIEYNHEQDVEKYHSRALEYSKKLKKMIK